MKKQIALLVVVATLACCSVSQASVTNAVWNTQNPTTLTFVGQNFDTADSTLGVSAHQLSLNTARMVGDIYTDTIADPTLTISSSVNNDTGFAWNGYQVNVVMSAPFSFTAPAPNAQNPPANDWFLAAVVPPTLQGGASPWSGYYEGTLDFSAGTPVGINGKLDFQYTISFGSSTHYILTQEMIPSMVTIPEPSTIALLAIGGLGLALRRSSRIGA
jgi:PEP-CTERM motif